MLFTWATSFKRHAKSSVLTPMTDTDTSQYLPSVPSLEIDWLLGICMSWVTSASGNTPLALTFSEMTSRCVVVTQSYKINSVHYSYFVFVTDWTVLYTWISVSYYAQRLNSLSFTTHRKVCENVQMDNRNEGVLGACIYWKLLSIILSLQGTCNYTAQQETFMRWKWTVEIALYMPL